MFLLFVITLTENRTWVLSVSNSSATNSRQWTHYVMLFRPLYNVHPSFCHRLFHIDATSLYLVERLDWNLSQTFSILVGTAEKVFKVRGQRSRSYVYKCVNGLVVETALRQGLPVCFHVICIIFFYYFLYYCVLRWRRGIAVECRTCDQKSWVRVSAGHYGVKTLGKFLTPMCLCHQAV